MIRAAWPTGAITAAADVATSRTIAGVAVPYGVEGVVSSGDRVVFEPGSLDATARPPAIRDHDRTRPIGLVTAAADRGAELEAEVRVSRTPAGDDTLVLAADGVLMFSVGAEPTRWHYVGDVLHVDAAAWQELSLLPIGAFAAARVSRVTASQPGGTMDPTTPPTLTDEPPDDELDDDETVPNPDIEPDEPVDTAPAPVTVTAGRGPGRRPAARGPYADVDIAGLSRLIMASRGPGARRDRLEAVLAAQGPVSRGIEAALADVTLVGTNNVGPLHRPAYQAELVELISWGTPLIDALRPGDLQRGDYPTLTFNKWETPPTVALQAAEKDEIHSAPVKISPASCVVNTWAGGNDISRQAIDLGSPSFVADYIRAAGIDYARKIDTYAATTLLTAAANVTSAAGDSFIKIVGALMGALSPATTPPGGLFLAMSYDVGVGLVGVPVDEGPAFWDGNVSFGAFTPTTNVGGLNAFVDPNLPPRTYLMGHRQGATWYDLPGTPFSLEAVNVGLLGLDIAVYGYGALGIQYPGAFTKTQVPVGP